jgi:hypothetical protein
VTNKRTNLGKTYLLNINTSITKIANANNTILINKKGTDWGIIDLFLNTWMIDLRK